MEELNYTVFILGYDLLNEYFKNSNECECDIVYEKCKQIAKDFNTSEYNKLNKSLYECLNDYLNNNKII